MTQYRTTTDENGDFSLDLPALEKGTYTMKAIFEGDSDAYGSEITKTLIIQGRAYAISIEANNEIIQSGDTTTLTLSFEDEDGDPVIEPGQTIKLYQEYVVSDIILTSDKDILSYADNDVATLTAKVKTSSGGIPVGVDVVFKKDGVLLDTVQTNTQGIATYSYASTGAGDITFSAECDLSSEIYVEDCIRYDNATSDKTSNYSSNNLNSLTFSTDHYEAYRSIGTSPSSTFYSPVYVDETLPSDFELSVMYNSSKMNTEQIEFIIAPNHPTTYSSATELGLVITNIRRGLFHRVNGTATWYTESTTLSNNVWYTFYLKVEGTTVTGTILDNNGDTVYTSTQTISNAQNYKKWSIINGGTSRTLSFKNLKIKSL